MRTIKFRAWNPLTNRMLEVYEIVFTRTGFSVRCKSVTHEDMGTLKNIPIMQFTGILDKDGREIYEGDIIQVSNIDTGDVRWDRAQASFSIHGRAGQIYVVGFTHMSKNQNTVLGNIYENPDLLPVIQGTVSKEE